MALSVVNGFLCYSSCDVKKALQGKNPHPKVRPDGEKARTDGPAVQLGGKLASSNGTGPNAVSPADASSQTDLSTQYAPVDITV